MNEPVVAIVDDDPRVIASLEELLESGGYATRSFPSAESLIAHGLLGVDVLITDVGMPGVDGFALRDLVRRTHPDMPVFVITGRHEIADQSRAEVIGGFLYKPFDGNVLLAAVRDALNSRRD
jgi:FixJ family two-component response regulator